MSGNLENDRSVAAGKMYPIDLAPQKITIVKSVSNTEMKMAHLIAGQQKAAAPGQIITHTGSVGLMRPAAQILSPGVSPQPQMIVSGPTLLQGTQIVSQGSQLLGQSSHMISQSQLISPSSQILSPATQIISQGTQLSAQVSSSNTGANNVQVSVPSSVSGAQVLSVGGLVSSTQGLVSGAANLVVNSSVRTLPPSVRVLPPLPHHNTRPVLSNVNAGGGGGGGGGVLVSKSVPSHVPRGLAAGASLAVRTPAPATHTQPVANQGGWSTGRGRGALVYGARGPLPRAAARAPHTAPTALTALKPAPAAAQPTTLTLATQPQAPHSAIVTLPTTTVHTSSVISGSVRPTAPRAAAPTPAPSVRPLPLLQRNYQPKVVGVASVGVRGAVGNSAPAQLYYEVPRPAPAAPVAPPPRHSAPYALAHPAQVSMVSAVQTASDARAPPAPPAPAAPAPPRPTILRKREIEGSPTKTAGVCGGPAYGREGVAAATGWEDIRRAGAEARAEGGSGGSTTMSASSSPAPDDEPDPPRVDDVSPRKKPRKQMLCNEIRQCQEFQTEEPPPTPPPVNPPPKRPLLSSSYVCGWRSTALHFARPTDVRCREPRAKDILAIASQKHVLTSAEGWKVHHLTAQMDDLVSLEADVDSQLSGVLRALEGAGGRALAALQPHSHALLELLKGNIQRSKIVCEGIQEARADIMRVFTHRTCVSDILARQADKRCFRKHRSQS